MIFASVVDLGLEWLIGFGMVLGLAFMFAFLTYKTLPSFIAWATIWSGFVVWSGWLDQWVLIVFLIALLIIIYRERRNTSGVASG